MRRVYLDTNAFSYCLRPRPGSAWTAGGLTELREQIQRAVRSCEIAILGSLYHVEEAARINESRRHEWMNFFWNTVLWHLLLPTNELVRLEASVRRPLTGNEPFDEAWRRQEIRTACLRSQRGVMDAMAPEVAAYAREFAEGQRDRKAVVTKEIAALYVGKTPQQVTEEWWTDSRARIAEWVNDYIRASKDHLRLPEDSSEWPTAWQLRTAWNMHAYQMARIVMTVGLNRKIGDGDLHDAQHYASASFGELLVTSDGGFQDTVALIPDAVRVVEFDTFAAELGVLPH